MNGVEITRKIEFDAAHRVMGHEGRCKNLHGHRYTVWVYATLQEGVGLDPLGRVVDFSVLKDKVGGWIDENWDHQTILCKDDGDLIKAVSEFCSNGSPFKLPYNPTAENIAHFLLYEVTPILFVGNKEIKINKIVVEETPNCKATIERSY